MAIDLSNTTLYSIKQVCEKLGVSRSTLDRWRGVAGNPMGRAIGVSSNGVVARMTPKSFSGMNDGEGLLGEPSFPAPDTYLNGSPRWTLETLNAWVNAKPLPKARYGLQGFKPEADE
ncbi:putative site-specific integrase-resolvase [Pseudomonas syringae pv. syringae HS191]|uniref:helix-turn-helix transcriptional regulator n=1 Tax=Pseudomonas syringae TaxID=317 RepID=UPI000624DAC3|nr:helix-turn-helix domain-containing protein [Pseudomonas syringae]AKF51857.1 putative site-specific integrase-resolvase [Pseudomonas syringae pv. syringae HS191]